MPKQVLGKTSSNGNRISDKSSNGFGSEESAVGANSNGDLPGPSYGELIGNSIMSHNNSNSSIADSINAPLKRKRKRHKNSRFGCLNCKKRRIKCGEELDACYNCMEKNLHCSFLDLSPDEKKKLLDRFQEQSIESAQGLELEEELQDLVREGHDFRVEKYEIDPDRYLQRGPLPDEEDLMITLDFSGQLLNDESKPPASTKKLSTGKARASVSPSASVSDSRRSNKRTTNSATPRNSKRYIALANATQKPEVFKLYKFERVKILDELMDTKFLSHEFYTISGEDDVEFEEYRVGLESWYQTLIDYGAVQTLSFHEDMTLAGNMILNRLKRSLGRSRQLEISILHRVVLFHKVHGLNLALRIIDLLNRPKNLSKETYLASVHKIIAYSLVNMGVSMLNEKDFKSFLTFVGGFLSTSFLKTLLQQFKEVFTDEQSRQSKSYYQFKFLHTIIPVIHSFLYRNVTALYMPNYNFDILAELYNDLLEFNANVSQFLPKNQKDSITELRTFLQYHLLNNSDLQKSYNQAAVTAFLPEAIYQLVCQYISIFPSNAVFIQSKYVSMATLEKIVYLYWLCASAILDNIFPEALFVCTIKFSGTVRFSGIDKRFPQSILEELNRDYKHQNPALYDYLYRRTFYLIRYLSFFSYRWRMFDRNTLLRNPYPESPLFDGIRFESRKISFLHEKQFVSLKKSVIKMENYCMKNPHYVDDNSELGLARPNHRNNVMFEDSGFDINENFDGDYKVVQSFLQSNQTSEVPEGFNIDTIPLSYLKLSEYGLIVNVDFRPNLKNNNVRRLNYDGDFYEKNELVLAKLCEDWNLVASREV